ncbi:uncharacterized protein ACIGJ3_014290 [Trichechus inunguis]
MGVAEFAAYCLSMWGNNIKSCTCLKMSVSPVCLKMWCPEQDQGICGEGLRGAVSAPHTFSDYPCILGTSPGNSVHLFCQARPFGLSDANLCTVPGQRDLRAKKGLQAGAWEA